MRTLNNFSVSDSVTTSTSGSVTLTSYDSVANTVSGTFNGTLTSYQGPKVVVTNGSFNVRYTVGPLPGSHSSYSGNKSKMKIGF